MGERQFEPRSVLPRTLLGHGRGRRQFGAEFRQLDCVAGGLGNNQSVLAKEGTVIDPPEGFFVSGSGGGASECVTKIPASAHNLHWRILKPSYQNALKGKYRQLPDVSWLADPYTGLPS